MSHLLVTEEDIITLRQRLIDALGERYEVEVHKSDCSVSQLTEFIQQFDRFDNFVDSIYRE